MHASIEQLLNLADSSAARYGDDEAHFGPVDRAHIESCSECRSELRRIDNLRARLRSLPELAPDGKSEEAVWAAITARHQQLRSAEEGRTRAHQWLPLGLAASLVLATLIAVLVQWPRSEMPAVSSNLVTTPAVPETAALVARSQQLEQILGSLRYEPRVVNARTAGTIAQLEDQIAWIDYGLGEGGDGRLSESDANALWRQRVELMNSLVHVRYAQAQRVDF